MGERLLWWCKCFILLSRLLVSIVLKCCVICVCSMRWLEGFSVIVRYGVVVLCCWNVFVLILWVSRVDIGWFVS